MSWYAIYGTGATLHGIERQGDGRVEFTAWLSVFWIPVAPLSSWSAVYAGERPPDGTTDDGYCFADARRIPHDWPRIFRTFARGLLIAAIAVAPSAVMIARTNGRAATTGEMIVVFASVLWATAPIFWSEHVRRKKLRGS
jgi:hypothetical protein